MDTDDFNSKDLIGRYIYVENDGVRNAAYQIKGIKLKDGNKVVLDIGDATLIRKWADHRTFPKDLFMISQRCQLCNTFKQL